jgi:uncharacterized protein YcfL
MRLVFVLLALLAVAACSSQQAIDMSQVKASTDSTYKSAKVGVGQTF